MTLLTLNAVGMTLGSPLFEDITLTLAKSDRIGLVGMNGSGKTTLLSIMANEVAQTSGEITRARGLRVGMVHQYVPEQALDQTLYQWVLASLPEDQIDYESWRVDVALADLEVPVELYEKPLSALSGGWQRTALLAAAWVQEPDLLLLDEPTNHLDLGRIALLQHWLATLPRHVAVVLTSHDRAFLDAVTSQTFFLRTEHSRLFQLPYTKARASLEVADAADERRAVNELNKAQQLRRQAAKLKNVGLNSGSDLLLVKTRQLTDRAEKIEQAARPRHKEQSGGAIQLANRGSHVRSLVMFDDAEIRAPDGRVLYRTGRKWINRGDRVVLLGGNGTGKTQLVSRLIQSFAGEDETIKPAASLVPGWSDQHLSQLDHASTPFELLSEQFDVGDNRVRSILAGAGIGIDMQRKSIQALSGGQKARLAMVVLRLQDPNFYILDEPTNHLDIEGQEALEAELTEQGAACLLVSHDRHFLRSVGNRFWWIRDRTLEETDQPDLFFDQVMVER